MILTTHAIVGSAVANIFYSHPAIGLPLSFFSHYLIDMLPHVNYGHHHFMNKAPADAHVDIHQARGVFQIFFVILDFVFAILLAVIFFTYDKTSFFLSITGAFLAMLPDVINFIHYKTGHKVVKALKYLHDKSHFHKADSYDILLGTLTQVAVVFVAIIINSIVFRLIR